MSRRLILVLVLASASAYACTCGWSGPESAKTMRQIAEWDVEHGEQQLIFEGTVESQRVVSGTAETPGMVMSLTPMGTHRLVTLRVDRMYRGTQRGIWSIKTGIGDADC